MNEEDRLERCIASLGICDEVLVVDSHSKDRTRTLAESLGARVIERDWPGHVAQKEFAIRAANHDWVLCVDADECLSLELQREISVLKQDGFKRHCGWRIPRCSQYLGRWIHHGTWYPDLQLRLFDRRKCHWSGADPHDRVETDGSVGRLSSDLQHHPYRNLSEHLQTIDRYTTTMAQGLVAHGKRARTWNLWVNPAVRFFRFYFLKLGFLEGWRGFLLACLASHYVRLKYAKVLMIQHQRRDPAEGDRPGPDDS